MNGTDLDGRIALVTCVFPNAVFFPPRALTSYAHRACVTCGVRAPALDPG